MAFVKRLTLIHADGTAHSRRLGKGRKKQRKVSRGLEDVEELSRKGIDALSRYADVLGSRHRRSTAKKKDGWLRDAPENQRKAISKAIKKLR